MIDQLLDRFLEAVGEFHSCHDFIGRLRWESLPGPLGACSNDFANGVNQGGIGENKPFLHGQGQIPFPSIPLGEVPEESQEVGKGIYPQQGFPSLPPGYLELGKHFREETEGDQFSQG